MFDVDVWLHMHGLHVPGLSATSGGQTDTHEAGVCTETMMRSDRPSHAASVDCAESSSACPQDSTTMQLNSATPKDGSVQSPPKPRKSWTTTVVFVVTYVMHGGSLNVAGFQWLAKSVNQAAKVDTHLCSATRYQLVLPSYQLAMYGLRAFSVAGLKLWYSLPRLLHKTAHSTASFGHSLKTFLLWKY